MKKIAAFLLVALMLSTAVFAEDIILIAPNPFAGAKTVTARIEGIEGNLFCGEIALSGDNSALAVAEAAFAQAGIEYETSVSPYGGSYITQAAGLREGAFGGYEGWLYYVDGISPPVSMSLHILQGGEEVVFIYTDFEVLVPVVETARDDKGVAVTITADVTTYDENWNAIVTRQPVAGAQVTVDGTTYVTDEQGVVRLSEADSAKEQVSFAVEKKNALGLPALVRLAPDFRLELPAVETPWYAPYLETLTQAGVTVGAHDATLTRADVVTALFELSGGVPVNYILPFADVAQDAVYAEAVRWAASQKIVNGFEDGTFRPEANVTRQDLAVMLARYQQAAQVVLPTEFEAPAFADNDKIAPYAAEAVYTLQKAGVVSGNEGKFDPTGTANWAQLGKMLSVFVISD